MNRIKQKHRRAVVIGASIAGSLLTKVLKDRFEEVVLIERDTLSETAITRKTVPQEHHVHLLLQRGRQIMESLYPGFLTDIESSGAETVDLAHGVKWFFGGSWKQRWPTGITAHYCSRTLIEHTLRKRASGLSGVIIRQKTKVRELIYDAEQGRVTGVSVVNADGETENIEADLVVDASGRGSKANVWLKSYGYGEVEEEQVVSKLGYVSRIYKRNPTYEKSWRVLLVTPKLPEDRRMAVVSPIEGNRYLVTTGGWFGAIPEPNEKSFLAYLRDLPVSDVYDVVSNLEPDGEFSRYQMPCGLRRRYDLMTIWPKGFLIVGDAVCSINPIYSQGMTVSAMQVEALQIHIDAYLAGNMRPQDLLRSIIKATEGSWQQAKAGDEKLPELSCPIGVKGQLKNYYFGWLASASIQNREVTIALLKVNNLVVGDRVLYSPGIACKVLGTIIAHYFSLKRG